MYYMRNKATNMRPCLELMFFLNSLLELTLWNSVAARKFLNTETIEKIHKRWKRIGIIKSNKYYMPSNKI